MAVASRKFQQDMERLYEQMKAGEALDQARAAKQARTLAGHTTPQATAAKYAKSVKGMHPQHVWPTAQVLDELTEPPTTPLQIMASCEPDDFQDSEWETLFPAANYPYVQKYAP